MLMNGLLKIIVLGLLAVFIYGCSESNDWYDNSNDSNYQAIDSTTHRPKVKITRGNGYGEEVPYESKYHPV